MSIYFRNTSKTLDYAMINSIVPLYLPSTYLSTVSTTGVFCIQLGYCIVL